MSLWLVLGLGGLITYLTRLSFIALARRATPPAWMARPLRYVPVAVLSAIILPSVLTTEGAIELAGAWPKLLAAAAAALVAWRTRSVVLTLLAGMVTLWVLLALAV